MFSLKQTEDDVKLWLLKQTILENIINYNFYNFHLANEFFTTRTSEVKQSEILRNFTIAKVFTLFHP